MIIARAAKGAALLLMIFGVVALIGCPAAAKGAPGADGAKGAQGDKGDTGDTGAPGPAALAAVGLPSDPHVILINNTDAGLIGDVKDPKGGVDVTTLFTGGVAPYTYRISAQPPDTSLFRATINDDNEIVVTKRTASVTDPAGNYLAGSVLTVMATDANQASATKQVDIRTNTAPTAFNWLPIIVGTQSEKYGNDYPAKNVVSQDINQGDTGGIANQIFTDGGSGAVAVTQRKALTYEITKISRGTGTGAGTGAEYATVSLTGSVLTITGLKSTWDKDATPAAHVPIAVEVEATDAGGLSVKQTVRVYVDGAPVVGDAAPPAVISKKATGVSGIVIRDLADHYEDPEGATVAVTIVGATIEPSVRGAVSIDGDGHLTLTPNNQGSATITFYAQTAGLPAAADAASYMANVYLDRDGDGDADAATTVPSASTIAQVLKQEIKVTITP